MKVISLPLVRIKPHYTVVVIGSGYGGAIAASRMSRAGQQVCLLERGKELQPGQYPDNLEQATGFMQVHTADGHTGDPTGLFDFHVHEGISVLVGCGLGGTSLINANVSIRPEDRVFEDTRWPSAIREEYKNPDSLLNKGYKLAYDMLKPNPLPDTMQLSKLKALEFSANANNEKFYRTDINVNFNVDGLNHVGVEQKPCNMCGNCCSGCNYSAKNTVLMNYLPDAVANGAEIFTEAAVQNIERKDGKWLVHFSSVHTGSNLFHAATSYVSADIVILSAGTLGSADILLRSRQMGLGVSDKTGCQFSGNGDVLGFGYNTDHVVSGVGAAARDHLPADLPGPCITGIIDKRNQPVLEDGMIIEDAAIPGVLQKILPVALSLDSVAIGVNEKDSADRSFAAEVKAKARAAESLVRGPYHGALNNTQAYLLMTHDGESGRFVLENNRLNIDWKNVGKEAIFQKADAALRNETKALSGTYIKNPVWIKEMHNELITVHPLGGCYMGDSMEDSVVNHKGQVFTSDDAAGVYDSFYITDGSVVPRSLGVNPLLTISAISERCCALIAADRGWTIDYSFKPPSAVTEVGQAQTMGVEFTETMRGFYTKGASDYKQGFDGGQASGESFAFTLTVRSEDVYATVAGSDHAASMSGTVSAPGLSAKPLSVSQGAFNLFVDDPTAAKTKLMKYAMRLDSVEGKQYYFKGFKYVHHDRGLDEWPDTSTLYITIFDGPDDKGAVIGMGVLHILMADFAKQMLTMRAVNPPSAAEALKGLAAFGKYFSKSLFEVYGGISAPDDFYDTKSAPRQKRPLRMEAPEYYPFKALDGTELLLTRYNGGTNGPVMLVHPFNGNRLSYAIDTIDTNLAEYLYANGYDVWLLDYRLSIFMPSSNGEHTCDEIAVNDHPAAIDKIRSVTGAAAVDVVGHCVGSITMFMSLLQGLQGVRSMVALQIASDFVPATQVKWKAGLHLPQVMADLGIPSLTAYADADENWENKLYDKFLKLYGDHVAGFCTSPVCHRMSFMFGPLYEHKNMNTDTHDKALIEMLGVANIKTYEQLTLMIRKGHLTDAKGNDAYMPHLNRLAIPITFIHGDKNQVFDPQSTRNTYDKLCAANGDHLYARHIIAGYGHNDCLTGKDAVTDVFPLILAHLSQFKN